MSTFHAVAVICSHKGRLRDERAPRTLLTVRMRAGGDVTRGFLLTGRTLIGDEPQTESDKRADQVGSRWRSIWNSAVESGMVPRVAHELKCTDCDFSIRIGDTDLRNALRRVADTGESSVELQLIPRIVNLS